MSNPAADANLRTFDVGMSVEALASAWARRENAPPGATVVVANEIAGRMRGGPPWTERGPDALMMAVVVRPSITIAQEPLLWVAGTLAAARAASTVTDSDVAVHWPDTILAAKSAGGEAAAGWINVVAQLAPGRIEHAIVSTRVRCSTLGLVVEQREAFVDEVRANLLAHVAQLQIDPTGLIAAFVESWSEIDTRMVAKLSPRGEARGRVVTIDGEGQLVLESPTGMVERVLPGHLRSLDPG